MPRSATDLFFALSAPVSRDILKYSDVQTRLLDGANPGHEISAVQWTPKTEKEKKDKDNKDKDKKQAPVDPEDIVKHDPWEAVILCSLTRTPDGGWDLVSFGCMTQGNSTDYRPMILCL